MLFETGSAVVAAAWVAVWLGSALRGRPALERHVTAWERDRNGAGVAADWRFTTADARIKLRKLYPTIDA